MDFVKDSLKGYTGAANLFFNEKIKSLQQAGENIYHLGFGQSPFPVPKCFEDSVKKHMDKAEYVDSSGVYGLRKAIVEWHARYDGFSRLHVDDVVVSPGSKEVIFLSILALNGDLLIPSPSWATYIPQCHLAGKKVTIVPTEFEDGFVLQAKHLRKTLKGFPDNDCPRILLLNSPNNPSGVKFPTEVLRELAAFCRERQIIVISDEIYARTAFDGKHDSIARYYPEGTIVTSGFSKCVSAGGWRVGYALFPPELRAVRDLVVACGSNTYSCAPAPMQYGIIEALERKDEIDDYIKHTQRILGAVGQYSFRLLFEAGFEAVEPEAGFYFMPNFDPFKEKLFHRGIKTGSEMCDALLQETKVALMPCDPTFLRPPNELTVRWCFINFDGATALSASQSLGLEKAISSDFLETYCKPTLDATKAVLEWTKNL